MLDFFDKTGVMAIGTRLRMLSDRVTKDSEKIFSLYKVGIKPKWYPVFFILSQEQSIKTITAIASEIGHSHPSVIKIVKEMSEAKLIHEQKDKNDGRKTNIVLSKKGEELAILIKDQYIDTTSAIDKMLDESRHNLWLALEEFENLLDEKSTYPRVQDEKKSRESKKVKIVNYEPKYAKAFQSLNEQWINQYFEMEEKDRVSLENPKEYILDKNGTILVALYNDIPVGVCALIKMNHEKYDYELAKMAVDPTVQGKGIGYIIGEAIIDKAKELNAASLYLETNSVLKPAISLYQKLGFKKVQWTSSPYARSNVNMELIFN